MAADDNDPFFVVLDASGKIDGTTSSLDMATRSWHGALDMTADGTLLEELRLDCQAMSFPANVGTFWLPAERAHAITRMPMPGAAAPPAALAGSVSLVEQLAAEVFCFHTAEAAALGHFDATISGAEFWAQVRRPGNARESIGLHWDKDEFFYADCAMFVHPQLSTVTYLTDHGAPTFVVDGCTPQALDRACASAPGGTDSASGADGAGSVAGAVAAVAEGLHASFPRVGKHVVFDGQLLHGAPAAWDAAGQAAAPAAAPAASAAPAVAAPAMAVPSSGGSAAPRVTFLVNVWLNHQPLRVRPLPKKKAALLSRAPTEAVAGGVGDIKPLWQLRPGAVPRETIGLTVGVGAGESVPLWELPLHQAEQRQVLRCRLPTAHALAQGRLRHEWGEGGDFTSGETVAVAFGKGCEATAAVQPVDVEETSPAAASVPKRTTGKKMNQSGRLADVERMIRSPGSSGCSSSGHEQCEPSEKKQKTAVVS